VEKVNAKKIGLAFTANLDFVKCQRVVAQTDRLPFDRLRANGGVLKSFDFPVHAELVEA